jgi:hypothetical protein
MIQQPPGRVEEDVLDGTIGSYQAIIVPSVDYLAPRVQAALENMSPTAAR